MARSPEPASWGRIEAMEALTPIIHQGRVAAIVIAGQAVIRSSLSTADARFVQAMCLYALQLADEGRTHEYTDSDAEGYAQAALRGR
jgi:hypothetical protein